MGTYNYIPGSALCRTAVNKFLMTIEQSSNQQIALNISFIESDIVTFHQYDTCHI